MVPLIEEPLALEIPPSLADLLATVPELSRAFVVGGSVRDAVFGLRPKDLDIEVYGTSYEHLGAALACWGPTDLIGGAFGVIKLTLAEGEVVDFSIPRRDSKVGAGHRGFAVEADPTLSPHDAAARRDFTMNALLYNPRSGLVTDHFGGLADLRAGVLRHTSPAFAEDPLRVLRGMQFVSRFELTAAADTIACCREIRATYSELPVERVREEWFKWAARSRAPARGLRFLRDTGWLEHFSEISGLVSVAQDPQWHPEGDVWEHTLHGLDALVELPEWLAADEAQRIVWTLAVLLHDVGKPQCTRTESRDGRPRIISPGHDVAGGPLAQAFLGRIGAPHAVVRRVVPLVVEHMAHLQALSNHAVRRLSVRVRPETVQSLAVVITADHFGRPPLPRQIPGQLLDMLTRAEQLAVAGSAPAHVLAGWHLLEAGWQEGPSVGATIRAAYEAQLDGAFEGLPGALAWLRADERWRDRMGAAVPPAFAAAMPAGEALPAESAVLALRQGALSPEVRSVLLDAVARLERALAVPAHAETHAAAREEAPEANASTLTEWLHASVRIRELLTASADRDTSNSLRASWDEATALPGWGRVPALARRELERLIVLLDAVRPGAEPAATRNPQG
jgi:tRNA nucleotidyltransferase (CCA-adding enzyme)